MNLMMPVMEKWEHIDGRFVYGSMRTCRNLSLVRISALSVNELILDLCGFLSTWLPLLATVGLYTFNAGLCVIDSIPGQFRAGKFLLILAVNMT